MVAGHLALHHKVANAGVGDRVLGTTSVGHGETGRSWARAETHHLYFLNYKAFNSTLTIFYYLMLVQINLCVITSAQPASVGKGS